MHAGSEAVAQMLQHALQHHRAGRLADAERGYRHILEQEPAHVEALHHLGLIALAAGEHARAIDLIETANQLGPGNPALLSNLAEANLKINRVDKAVACAQQALDLQPGFVPAHLSLGVAMRRLGKFEPAQSHLRAVLGNNPGHAVARLNLGLLCLLQGDYASGLELFESRLDIPALTERGDAGKILHELADVPRWSGESLRGKRLLVWTEQGLGDSVMMLRFLPALRRAGVARLAVSCEQALVRLIESCGVADEIMATGLPHRSWCDSLDFHCPMMSLPFALKVRPETIPRETRYLTVPPELRRQWHARASALPAPRIGVVWAGGSKSDADARRSIALPAFRPLLETRGPSFVSLQKERDKAQLASVAPNIIDWMDDCGDLLETAALIEQLDLVISVDTAVAHLAGALGKPVWLLNRTDSEWRWMHGRTDTPWYPAMRIFNQVDYDWTALIAKVTAAVKSEFRLPSASMWQQLSGWLRK